MLLTRILTTGSVLYTGAKLQTRKKKKAIIALIQQAVTRKHQEQHSSPSLNNKRNQQLAEVSASSGNVKDNPSEKEINQFITISSVSMALSTVGFFIYPPLALLSVPGVIWIGKSFLQDAYQSIVKEKKIRLSIIESVFIIGTIGTGNYLAASWGALAYAISRKLLIKTEDHSQKSLINVFGEQPSFVWLLKDGVEVESPFETLQCGDVIVIHAGETIPVDGRIVSGIASVDQHTLTGESQPVEKGVGDAVLTSTIILSGKVLIEVEKTGEDTVAAQISTILSDTADYKNSLRSWGEKIGDKSVAPTLALGTLSMPFLGAVGALPIFNSCMGLYMSILAPLSMLTYLNLASQHGVLIKDGRVLDLLKEVDTCLLYTSPSPRD